MPLKKIVLKPGVNRENTRYTNENGWYDSDKVRFRQGTPEKIGGWVRVSANTFLGTCRSLWTWVTLGSEKLVGVGTNLKFYISSGGAYFDSTPYNFVHALGANPFTTDTTTNTTIDGVAYTTVTVTDAAGGFAVNDYVDLYNAPTVNGVVLTGSFFITSIGVTTYTILVPGTASASGSGGGTGVYAFYEIDTGPEYAVPLTGWGAGAWDAKLSVPRRGRFSPVAADFGPDGRLYVLERAFRAVGSFSSRLRRFDLGADGLTGEATLLETPFELHDNLEGLSVWRDDQGVLRATMISDDNFIFVQQTQIVEYRLPD